MAPRVLSLVALRLPRLFDCGVLLVTIFLLTLLVRPGILFLPTFCRPRLLDFEALLTKPLLDRPLVPKLRLALLLLKLRLALLLLRSPPKDLFPLNLEAARFRRFNIPESLFDRES